MTLCRCCVGRLLKATSSLTLSLYVEQSIVSFFFIQEHVEGHSTLHHLYRVDDFIVGLRAYRVGYRHVKRYMRLSCEAKTFLETK